MNSFQDILVKRLIGDAKKVFLVIKERRCNSRNIDSFKSSMFNINPMFIQFVNFLSLNYLWLSNHWVNFSLTIEQTEFMNFQRKFGDIENLITANYNRLQNQFFVVLGF